MGKIGEVKKQLPAGVYEKATVLHLRGAMIETYNRVVDSALDEKSPFV